MSEQRRGTSWLQGDDDFMGSELIDMSGGSLPPLEAPDSSSSSDEESDRDTSGVLEGSSSIDTVEFFGSNASWNTSVHVIEDEFFINSSMDSSGSSISCSEDLQRKPPPETSQVPALLEAGDRPCKR